MKRLALAMLVVFFLLVPLLRAQTTGISGRVADIYSVGIQNICVVVSDSDQRYLASGYTDVNGNYEVSGLPAGNLKVYFGNNRQNYISEYYNDKNDFKTADPVTVIAGRITPNIDAQLTVGGQFSGRVTDNSGVGIPNIEVDIRKKDGNNSIWVAYAYTDANGNYLAMGLPSGSYWAGFNLKKNAIYYVPEFYDDKPASGGGDSFLVYAGSITPNIDAQLDSCGSIAGRITNVSGVGIKGISVVIHDLVSGAEKSTIHTNAQGEYSANGLLTGNYKVEFYDFNQIYVREWYNDKKKFSEADPVAVIAGGPTPGIDAQLATGGQISGRVTNASGIGIQSVIIHAYDLDYNSFDSTSTNATGNYTLHALPAGELKVFFTWGGKYLSEWYNDKSSFATANPVTVTAANTTKNINAQLAIGGTVTGRVTDTASAGIENANVELYDLDHKFIRSTWTDQNGDYSAQGLPTGSYKIYFSKYEQGYLSSEWYNNCRDFDSAKPVAVTAGSTTSHIDVQLQWGEAIKSTITLGSPNGGERWEVDDSHPIIWNSTGSIYYVNIDYSIDGGVSWNPVTVNTDNDGRYDWTVFDAPSATCLVRVSNATGGAADTSDAMFTIWTNTRAISGKITRGGSGLAAVVLDGLPGNPVTDGSGFYSVRVYPGWSGTVTPTRPYYAFVPSSTTYTNVTANQTTNYTTTLDQPLVVTSPDSTSIWEAGTTQAITWSHQGVQNNNVRINLYKGTSTWVATLAAKTANDGSFNWLVPKTLAAGGNYFIRVQTSDNLVRDDSDKFSIIVPAITVTAPATGTVWAKGTTKTITWSKVGTQDANVRIQLNRGTIKVLDITASTPNSGSFDWAIPATLANALYTVRITTLDGKVKGVSKSFTVANGMIRVTAPAAGALWQRGEVHTITWSGEGMLNANVRIQLLKGDQVAVIAATTPNDGSFDWFIPADKALASYKIRVTTVDNQITAKSGLFAITSSAGLTLLAPNGDEVFRPLETQAIRWSVDPEVLEVKLEFSRDNGSTFSTIADHAANTGRYEWQVPVNFTRNGIVRVSDANGRPWRADGLLEFSFKFMCGGEGDEAGMALWFGGMDSRSPSYGFAKIALARDAVQFSGFTRSIEPLKGSWHELRVRFDFHHDTGTLYLDDQALFENIPLFTSHDHYFEPSLALQAGGNAPLDFMMDDLAVNVIQLDDSGRDRQVFNVLADDFDRYDEQANVLQNCWKFRNVDDKKNKAELDMENGSGKALRLCTAAGKRLVVHLPIALPERVPFDISDKDMAIENR